MSKKISDVYNENPAAGDDTSMVSYFPAEAADGTPVAYSDEQLMALAGTRLNIADLQAQIDFLTDAIAEIPWQPVAEDSGQFTATINADSLNVLVTGSINFDSDRYVAMVGDDSTPTGAVGSVYTWPANTLKSFQITLWSWDPAVLRIWARRTVDSVWIMLDPNPSNGEAIPGLLLTPTATAAPSKPTFVTDQTGVDPATEFNYTIGAVTTPDSAMLSVELWGAVAGLLEKLDYEWDGTTPIEGTYSDLSPSTNYWPFAKVYVTSDPSRSVTSDQDPITTADVGEISNVTVTAYVGSFSTDTITAITNASPGVITTSAAHGLDVGDWIKITGVVGMTELNNRTFYVSTVPETDELTLEDKWGNPIDTTVYTAYASGGVITEATTTPITDISLDATATSYGVDEILFLYSNDPTWDANDPGWQAISGASSLPIVAYGDTTVYARGRNSSYPTSMTPVYSFTVSSTAGTGNAVISFTQTIPLETTEIGAPTINLTVTKANDDTAAVTFRVITSDGVGVSGYNTPGQADINYKAINKEFSLPNGTTSVTIPVTILEYGLGSSDVDFFVAIDEASVTNADVGATQSVQIIVKGSHGWLPYVSSDTGLPELDVNNPPVVMDNISIQNLTGNQTISGKRIDAQYAKNAIYAKGQVNLADGGDNRVLIIENCDIMNAGGSLVYAINYGYIKLRNCRLFNGGRFYNGAAAFAPNTEEGGDSRYRKIETLNNRFELTQGGEISYICYSKDTDSERYFSYNYMKGFIQIDPVAQGTNKPYGNVMFRPGGWHAYQHILVEGNVFYQHRRDGETAAGYPWPFGHREDVWNFWNSSGRDTGHGIQIHANIAVGCGLYAETGAFGIQTDDKDIVTQRNFTVTCNTVSNTSCGALSTCRNISSCYGNFVYSGYPNTTYYEDAVEGIRFSWDNKSGVAIIGSGVPESPYTKSYIGLNYGMWYGISVDDDPTSAFINFKWTSTPATPPNGWGTNELVNAYSDPVVGHNRFRKMRFPIMYQDKGDGTFGDPSFDDDIEWLYFSHDFPLGDAKVTYIAATKQLNLAPHGGSAGAYIDFDVPQWQDTTYSKTVPMWYVYTAAGDTGPWGLVRLRNGGTNLPATDTVYTVKVTRFTPYDRSMYVGPTGYRTGAVAGQAPTGDDVTPPETPPAMLTVVDDTTTTIHGTCSEAIDNESDIDYYIWRVDQDPATDKTSVGQTSPSFTVTEGVHNMQVAARDTAGNQTTFSVPMEVDTTGTTYDITNTEFNDTSGWTAWQCAFTASGGIGNIANNSTSAGQLWQAFTIGAGDTVVHYDFKLRAGLTDPSTHAIVSLVSSRPTYPGTMNGAQNPVHYLMDLPLDGSWIEQSKTYTSGATNWPGPGTYYIQIWINNTGLNKNLDIDYFRLWMT